MKKSIIFILALMVITIGGISIIKRVERERTPEWKMIRYALEGHGRKFKIIGVYKRDDEKMYSYNILANYAKDAEETEYADVVRRLDEYYINHDDDFGAYEIEISFRNRKNGPTLLYLSSICSNVDMETRGLKLLSMCSIRDCDTFSKFSSAILFDYVSEIEVWDDIILDDYTFLQDMTYLKYIWINKDLPGEDVLKMKKLIPNCEIDCGIIGK